MARTKEESHQTAELILASAKTHFLHKGFDGASINDIANEAQVNKSLIYHHFGSKEKLWKAVKEHILDQRSEVMDFKRNTLREFLENFVTFRFNLYAQNPELVRLMSWQRLDPQVHQLAGVTKKPFTDLEQDIVHLQQVGEIRTDLDPAMINYLIMSMASNAFMDQEDFVTSTAGQARYLRLIIESLYKALTAKG